MDDRGTDRAVIRRWRTEGLRGLPRGRVLVPNSRPFLANGSTVRGKRRLQHPAWKETHCYGLFATLNTQMSVLALPEGAVASSNDGNKAAWTLRGSFCNPTLGK